jgi:HPt (histidine-containing phosphotransfer) domain-containing protein
MVGHVVKPIDVEDLLELVVRKGIQSAATGEAPHSGPTGATDSLPGIEIDATLSIFGGDKEACGKLLGDFVAQHGGDVDTALSLFSAGDTTRATRLLHTLSGLCGFIRATEVASLASEIERLLLSGDIETARNLFAELEAAMHTLVQSINHFNHVESRLEDDTHTDKRGGIGQLELRT